MDLVLTLAGDAVSGDELRSLQAWLLEEDELRGRIRAIEKTPAPDSLGPILDALRIVADPAAAVLTASLVAWLKSRVGGVRLVLKSHSGAQVELDAKCVRGLDAEALVELTGDVARLVSGAPVRDRCCEGIDVSAMHDGEAGAPARRRAAIPDS